MAETEDDGHSMSLQESVSMADERVRAQSLIELKQVVDFFPAEEKEAYIEARMKCPQLIEIESKPLKFLLFNRFDIWKSAHQVSYIMICSSLGVLICSNADLLAHSLYSVFLNVSQPCCAALVLLEAEERTLRQYSRFPADASNWQRQRSVITSRR